MDSDVMIANKELSKHKVVRRKLEPTGGYKPPFQLLSKTEVCDVIRVSSATLYRMINKDSSSYDPTFPQPVRISGKHVFWRADELTNWLENLQRGTVELSWSTRPKAKE